MGNSTSTSASYVPFASEDETAFWSKVPLFQLLPKEVHPELTSCSQKVDFTPGQVIIRQGDQGDEFYVIKRGVARITCDGAVLTTLQQGDYFGETALLRSEPRTATITAVTEIEALRITGAAFRQLGLHEKLTFPKREKVKKRHMMMASGAAGKLPTTKMTGELGSAIRATRNIEKGKDDLFKPEPRGWCAGQMSLLKEIFIDDRMHMTAFFLVPLGQIVKFMDFGPGPIFFANFVAIIPLASILGQATEALSNHTGQVIGGLLNATFGNVVEMIMCVQAVKAGLIDVVQGNLLGSVLSNLLLVLGMAIFAAGTARKTQTFNAKGAAANISCQLVASISICLPTCFAAVSDSSEQEVLMISRICSIFLMSVYGLFLFFMLKTHAELFVEEEEENEEEDAVLSPTVSTVLLAVTTLVVFLASECLVDSIEGVSEDWGLSKTFIGVILLPIVGNAAEHATAVSSAHKGMMDLALGVAVGSSTQIALFVVPCAVCFGWIFDQPMNLNFTIFDTTCQMLTVFLVSQVLAHGETNWLHGAMLVTVYIFIAVQCLFLKGPEN